MTDKQKRIVIATAILTFAEREKFALHSDQMIGAVQSYCSGAGFTPPRVQIEEVISSSIRDILRD